jgi:hypothetical protein
VPDHAEPPFDDEEPVVAEAPDYFQVEDYAEPPPDDEVPAGDTPDYVEAPLADVAEVSAEEPDYFEATDYVEPVVDADLVMAEEEPPAQVEPPGYVEPAVDVEEPDFVEAPLVDKEPSGAELYQAFVPRRMRRDRLAAMSYPKAIELVSRWRKKGDPPELGDLDMSDEEIAAAIQDYARAIDTKEDRSNWLLGQILEEQQRQTRHLRGVKTVLILLIAAIALAAITSCVLTFVQFPNLMP